MKWVTRERPKTDRIACPWLIKNFIDPDAEFFYVAVPTRCSTWPSEEGAHSYDAPGAKYTHRDGLCSFEVLVEEYEIDDDPAVSSPGTDRPWRRCQRRPRRDTRSRAGCSPSPKASTCSTSATTANWNCPSRSTTLSTPGAGTR